MKGVGVRGGEDYALEDWKAFFFFFSFFKVTDLKRDEESKFGRRDVPPSGEHMIVNLQQIKLANYV